MAREDLILPQTLMRVILDNACSNPYYPPGFDYKAAEKKGRYEDRLRGYVAPPGGWWRYRIETHCVAFDIIARKVKNPRTKKYTWQIKSFTTESC